MAERSDDASGRWTADVDAADGDHYWLVVDDGPPLLDPHCRDVALTTDGPRSVFRAAWAPAPQAPPLDGPPTGPDGPDGPDDCEPVRERDGVHIDPSAAPEVLTWLIAEAIG